mmetsp:Transcript_28990/g.73217  ORF Transcript_28990/g.73217 Transcript_28990/m.73217 type:complete len:215 (+) Transcript_28990:1874-2518(+)
MTSERRIRVVTVESTITVRTRSPTSAVSPPVDTICTPICRSSFSTCSVPSMIALTTDPGMTFLFRPSVLDNMMLSTTPTHKRSSKFITIASWATPFHTDKSPVRFQYIYAREALVPAPSACITMQWCGLQEMSSGTILQKAFGNKPWLMSLMALCTSAFPADTPLFSYLDATSRVFSSSLLRFMWRASPLGRKISRLVAGLFRDRSVLRSEPQA